MNVNVKRVAAGVIRDPRFQLDTFYDELNGDFQGQIYEHGAPSFRRPVSWVSSHGRDPERVY